MLLLAYQYPSLCFKVAAKTVLPLRSPAVEFFEHDAFAGGAMESQALAFGISSIIVILKYYVV